MSKLLELVGYLLVGGRIYAFVGPIPRQEPMGWPIFSACAVGALAIIIYNRRIKMRADKNEQ